MKKENNGKRLALGAIAFIVIIIAALAVMNYYASGWNRYLGIEGPSFLTVFLIFLGAIVIGGVANFLIWNRPKKQHRAKYAYHPNLQHKRRRA